MRLHRDPGQVLLRGNLRKWVQRLPDLVRGVAGEGHTHISQPSALPLAKKGTGRGLGLLIRLSTVLTHQTS